MPLTATKVRVTCISKKESFQFGNPGGTKNWEIELAVPYDSTSIYYKMSGGTNFHLNTINEAAASMFEIGKEYDFVIGPKEGE